MFDVDCENWFEIFIYTFEDWKKSILENENKYKKECEKYEQAIEKIEEYQKRNCEVCYRANTEKCNESCQVFVIFDIINKAKDGE